MQPADDHDVVWGVTARGTRSRFDRSPLTATRDRTNTESIYSLFAQDEIKVSERLAVTLGSKFEHNSYTGWEIQPDLRLAFTPNEDETWWASVSRAVRTPSTIEWEGIVSLAAQGDTPAPGITTLAQLQGFENVKSEDLTSLQVGYRVDVDDELSLDATAYYHHYDDLITLEVGTPSFIGPTTLLVPAVTDNKRDGRVFGFEMVADWRPTDDWDVVATYAYADEKHELDSDSAGLDTTVSAGDLPQSMVDLSVHHDIDESWSVDLSTYYVDELPALGIDDYVSAKVRVAWHDEVSEWSFGLVNLFHHDEPDWAGEFVTANSVEAAAYLKYTRRF